MITRTEKRNLFQLGRDRYAWHGRGAYLMKYPHHGSEAPGVAGQAAQAYIAGVKSLERGLSVEQELKIVLH